MKGLFFLAMAFFALGCGDPAELLGPDAAQGIVGTVLLGPTCPVQSEDMPCPDRPYRAWIAVRTTGGSFVSRVRSGEDGSFRVGLKPGGYVLSPESGDPFPRAEPQDVQVLSGVYAEVSVSFDTGIR
jgi:hypothetical protein